MVFNLIIISLFLPLAILGKDLGFYGHTFDIAEEDLLQYLKNRIKNISDDELKIVMERYGKRFQEFPIKNLKRAKEYRTYFYDPSLILGEDIRDVTDKIIIKKGTKINPLENMNVTENLIFFDGTSKQDIKWAQNLGKNHKWILVRGDPMELEKQFKVPVYFDQNGYLLKTFKIESIPVKISQDRNMLKIEEIPLDEE